MRGYPLGNRRDSSTGGGGGSQDSKGRDPDRVGPDEVNQCTQMMGC
jgi:hypothetical protein